MGCRASYAEGGDESPAPRSGGPLDGQIADSFDGTIHRILARIDRLVGDDRLWRVPAASPRLASREASARTSIVENAATSIDDGNRPSHKYRVELAALDGGHFVALLRLKDGSVLAGYGESAKEALLDFDRAWVAKRPDYTPMPEPVSPRMVGPSMSDDSSPDTGGENPPPDPAGTPA